MKDVGRKKFSDVVLSIVRPTSTDASSEIGGVFVGGCDICVSDDGETAICDCGSIGNDGNDGDDRPGLKYVGT